MKEGVSVRYRRLKGKVIVSGSRSLRIYIPILFVIILAADACIFSYFIRPETWTVIIGFALLVFSLIFSLIIASFPFEDRFSNVGGVLSIIAAVSVLAITLPSIGDPYQNSAVFSLISIGSILLWRERPVDKKAGDLPRITILVLLLILPVVLALGEYLILDRDFFFILTESPPFWFLPIAAMFGYFEEMLFRGGLQRNLEKVTSPNMSLLAGATLNAGLMVFWGSLYVIAFVFVIAMMMGYVFQKYRSASLCGLIRMIESFSFVLMLILS